MADQELRDLVLQTLKDNKLAALATVSSDGVPHAATVVYAVDDDFNIYFVTRENTSKVKNLEHNPVISLSIGATPPLYVQMRGKAERMSEGPEREERLTAVAEAGAGLEDVWPPILHIGSEDYVLFKVVPDLIHALDLRDQNIAAEHPPFIEIL